MSRSMKIADEGSARLAPNFETPLAMLTECHRRVEEQCSLLQRLVPYLAAHGVDRAAADAAKVVLRHFDLTAPKHHADEEEDLFPALIESMAGSDAVCLQEVVRSLRADHETLEQQWRSLRTVLVEAVDGKPVTLDEAAVNAFARHYEAHIASEESELLPMAKRLLSSEVIEEIGRSMRRRRGEVVE